SAELLERTTLFLERVWIPAIPRGGFSGASGNLIALAYLSLALQGKGKIYVEGKLLAAEEVLKIIGLKAYHLKPKEGLALVNGTTAMAGLLLTNIVSTRRLLEIACTASS